jgi:membrane-associated phospholipid phosphatase
MGGLSRLERVLWIGVLAGLLMLPGAIPADHRLMPAVSAWRWAPLLDVTQRATWLGYGAVDIGLVLLFAVFGWWGGDAGLRTRGLVGALTVAGAGILDQVVKNVACRARPSASQAGIFFAHFPCFPASYAYASFPSGHATTAFATAVILSLWYPRGAGLFVGLALVAGLSRVVLGAHFPSDVLAGAVVGSAVALTVHALVGAIRNPKGARAASADARLPGC